MEGKKISFGFKKVQRAGDSRLAVPALITAPEEKIHYIDCVEDSAIKVVGGEAVEEKVPLVIPVKPNTLSTDRFQQIAAEVEPSLDDTAEERKDEQTDTIIENETLEQQAARELLEEAKNLKKVETQVMTLPLQTVQPLTGQKEPTLDDYEAIPIADYGMAMLRGMGWTPGQASKYTQPVLRPKGLGLGADKLVKQDATKNNGGKGGEEELTLKKGCYVRIIAGKYSGAYGKVLSLNEEGARATVELALGHDHVEIGEQLLQPVTRKVYDDRSRVLNADKYDKYKKKEGLANERPSSSKNSTSTSKQEYNRHDSKRCVKRGSSSDEGVGNGKSRGRSSSREYEKRTRKIRDSKQTYSSRQSSNGTENYKRVYKKDRVKRSSSSEDETNRNSQNDHVEKQQRDSSSLENYSTIETKTSNLHRDSSSEGRTERKERRTRSSSRSSEDNRARRKHRSKTKHKKTNRSRSIDSLTSTSSDSHKRSKIKKNKNKSVDAIGKRDIDKKRKGKKKKRDRDRSPNYRKHKR